ncbi:hypothetical protein BC829DRAFT_378364 [Chytridium lagenaria]|nr:hypothetical protein BC829DRAFT_378364 [Chytridium lagenaria]
MTRRGLFIHLFIYDSFYSSLTLVKYFGLALTLERSPSFLWTLMIYSLLYISSHLLHPIRL